MNDMTPETLTKGEVAEVFAILRNQDAVLGRRLVDRLETTLLKRESRIEELEAADETAWGIIANAKDWNVPDDGSPRGNTAKKWREAAIGWRDERHKRLAAIAAQRRKDHERHDARGVAEVPDKS